MTIIKQIKAEIERRIETHHTYNHFCAEHEFRDVLSFISTLEKSETSINKEELEVELDIWRHIHFNGARDGHFSGEYLERTSQLDLAYHFARWQKEQMMKKAICANVYPDDKEIWCCLDRFPELKEGDKVRIIIVKEDE